ncbi:MAG: beta-ketoacyl-[acyl-carrier-protein] synthase II [Gammaproteobacteria bacterium]|nr:MAG: beta-ketoacyl-[acyl-carrier-protein] synthase II [Gammaproteobacteria bacterium]
MIMKPEIKISSATLVSALGCGIDATLKSLLEFKSGLKPQNYSQVDFETYLGEVKELKSYQIDDDYKKSDCRNNRLTQLCLNTDNFKQKVEGIKQKYGSDNIPLFLATSTSGITTTEQAYQNNSKNDNYQNTHQFFSLAKFVSSYLNINSHMSLISTACSSSAKAVVSAMEYIQAGLSDVAIVGVCDSLCLTTIYGFHSLGLLSAQKCAPWDENRGGTSLGEAAAFLILEKCDDNDKNKEIIKIKGFGESVDGFHMSTPHPDALGAKLAINSALDNAGLSACDVDYINLHGTATAINDKTEDLAIKNIFSNDTMASSTKGGSGHTLAASGIVELIICMLSIQNNMAFGTMNTTKIDKELSANIILKNTPAAINTTLSNSFGFGGNNCCLILGSS